MMMSFGSVLLGSCDSFYTAAYVCGRYNYIAIPSNADRQLLEDLVNYNENLEQDCKHYSGFNL